MKEVDQKLRHKFCHSLKLMLLAGSYPSDRDHTLMNALSPALENSGIDCTKYGRPASLKRLCKLSVRSLIRKPLSIHLLTSELPQSLQKYLHLEDED